MAKALSTILSQIERLQQQAAAIQLDVIKRIRKEIATHQLTPEQLFGQPAARKTSKGRVAKPKASGGRPPKYADGTGRTWAGVGKRPEWIRQALAAGQVLEEFLVGKPPRESDAAKAPKVAPKRVTKSSPTKAAATSRTRPTKKRATAKKAPAVKKAQAAKRTRAKPAVSEGAQAA